MNIMYLGIGLSAGALFFAATTLASIYTIVPADFADVVIQSDGRMKVFSSHRAYNTTSGGKSTYFNVPSWFFIGGLGRVVHRIPLRMIPISVPNFLAFDSDRARFVCDITAYVTVKDPIVAAQRFSGNLEELEKQISILIQSTTRDATTKKTVREIINNREGIMEEISTPLAKSLDSWGLDLKSIELIDFKDPDKPERDGGEVSHVIDDISSMIETTISSEARQKNAEQKKLARIKEAEAEQNAKQKEIEAQELIAVREQSKNMKVAEQQNLARVKELEVTRTQEVKTQEIEKQRAVVEAEQKKDVEEIYKQQQKLKGEGERLFLEEQAKGKAASILENGIAEAKAKDLLQQALNKFGNDAIKALVAEKIVQMQQEIGIATANAIGKADTKVFVGSDNGGGFDIGKVISAAQTSNDGLANAVLNKIARQNDLGFEKLNIKPEVLPKA